MNWPSWTGADLPFTDPSRDHDVGMQGSFWRFVGADETTIVLHGRCRGRRGRWSLVAIAREPGGVSWAIGDDLVDAGPTHLRVHLPDDAFTATWTPAHPWPSSAFGGLGPAQSLPFLGQYWHPHLLRGTTPAGTLVYAERNWGSRFAPDWWWGQAFVGEATVCFAGGRQFGQAPTALVVALPDRLIRVVPPLHRIKTAAAPGRWRIRTKEVEVEAEADPEGGHLLPVPIPDERRAVLRSRQHLSGRLRVTVRGGFAGETDRAGLERGEPWVRAKS